MAYNHRIHFERQATTVDAAGQQSRTWAEIGGAWSKIEPIRGRDYFIASGEKADVTHKISAPYQASLGLIPADRVRYGSRYFDIESVINVGENNRELQLMCREVLHTNG